MKRIKIGIMPKDEFQQYMIDIAAGHVVPKRGEPKIWFHSMKSVAEVLSDKNRELLKIIADQEPETIQELADITGREPSNLGRTLRTFENYGLIRIEKHARSKKPIAQAMGFDIQVTV